MGTNHPKRMLRSSHRVTAFVMALLLAFAAVFSLGAGRQANAQDKTVKPDATIRVLNASPGTPAIDVLINGQPLVQNLAFGAPSSYASLKPDSYKVQVVPAGQPAANALAEKDFDAASGAAYIVSIVNPLKDIKVNVDEVNLDAIDQGKARVRFVQDSPDAGKVSLAVTGGDKWFDGVSSGDKSDYKDVDAGTYSLDLKDEHDTTLNTAKGIQVEAGHVYDIFAIGQIADKSLSLVSLVTVVSPPCAAALNLQATDTDACVRIVHAAPGVQNVDVYVNGSPASTNLGFGSATDFLAVPAGDSVKIQVAAAGSSVDKAAIDETISLSAGQAYQLIATGATDDLKLSQSRLDLTPLPSGQARVRVINASPDAGSVDLKIKDGETIFSGIDYRSVTDYKVIDAGTQTVDMVKNGESQVLSEGQIELKDANVYDIILIGQSKDQSLKVLAISAPASVRSGSIATPSAQGTAMPAPTVSTVATVASSPGALTTPQAGASVTPTP